MRKTLMKIGVLLPGHPRAPVRAVHGGFDDMARRFLAGRGLEIAAWDVEGGEMPASPAEADGWLVMGSRHAAYEDHPWLPGLRTFVRAAHGDGVPLGGICFGHQVIAQALGGEVRRHPDGWALGATDYDTPDGPMTLMALHQDQVTRPPEGAVTWAANAHCRHAGLRIGPRTLTVQAHPEFTAPVVASYVDALRGTGPYPDALMDSAAASLGRGLDADRVAGMFAALFHGARADAA
jgi:GMP synthase-like glutamine amidotransferase